MSIPFFYQKSTFKKQAPSSSVQITFTPKLKTDKPSKNSPRQIIEQRRDLSYVQDKAPKKAQFLSQYHQKVLKQTVSRLGSGQTDQKTPLPQKTSALKSSSKLEPAISDLMPKIKWDDYIQKAENKRLTNKKMDSVEQITEKDLKQKRQINSIDLTHNMKVDGGRGDGNNDYLKDIEEGEQTLLNTQAFKFYTYYARIKEQVQPSWKSMVENKVRDILLRGEMFLVSQQRTSLLITLDRSGVLVDIEVLEKSQINAFDHIAIESFQITAPFPHPPEGLMNEDGILKIKWDFIIETNV